MSHFDRERRSAIVNEKTDLLRLRVQHRHLKLEKKEETIKISRLYITTGREEPWQTLKVASPGLNLSEPLALSPDGKACAFTFQHDLANLYLVTAWSEDMR